MTAGIIGIVLAAGRSSRMGRPKALLPYPPAGETFAARVVRTLRDGGVGEVVVVGRASDAALRALVERLDATYLENPDPDRGQLSSLIVGIEFAELRRAPAVLAMPVDMPLVRAETVAAAIASFDRSDAPIARVVHQGRHGHPVIFRSSVYGDLRAADISVGAKAILRARAAEILNVEVDDAGVLRDIDLPEDYRRILDPGHS